MNKKAYSTPEVEIEKFLIGQDICTFSSGLEESDNSGDLGGGGGLDF